MATKTIDVTYVVTDKDLIRANNTTIVGNGGSVIWNDSVWSFIAPANNIEKITFHFKWDILLGGTGFRGAYEYVAALSTSGANGRTAATGTHIQKDKATLGDGSSTNGSWDVVFENIELVKGNTYYVRLNQNGTTKNTIKTFLQNVVAEAITKSGIRINVNGEWKEGTPFVNVNGEWKEGTPYININGIWKEGV